MEELTRAIVSVQCPFPDDLATGPLHDRALAAAEHDKVVAFG
jgi:hypothetical protein